MYASFVIGILFAALVNAGPQFPGPPPNWDGVVSIRKKLPILHNCLEIVLDFNIMQIVNL